MQITIQSFTIPNWQMGGSTGKLRLSYKSNKGSFVSGSRTIVSNEPGEEDFYQDVAIAVSGSGTVAQFQIDTTTDSSDPNAKLTGILLDANDNWNGEFLFQGFRIPASLGSSLSYSDLVNYQGAPATYTDPANNGAYTVAQANARFVHLSGDETLTGVKSVSDPTTALQIANKGYVDAIYGPYSSKVLQFTTGPDDWSGGHVHLGAFTIPGHNYRTFHIDMLVKPTAANQGPGYFLSPGWGGAHVPALIGYQSSNGKFSVTGNIWDNAGSQTISFSTAEKFDINQWCYIAVVYDGIQLIVTVNGVVEEVTAFVSSTGYIVAPAATDTSLYFGGSNHNKAAFKASWLRIFMDTLPLNLAGTNYAPFTNMSLFPQTAYYDGSKVFQCQGLWDFSKPGNIITDESNGLSSGVRQKITNDVLAGAGITGNGNAKSVVTATGMSNSPKTVTIPVTTALTTAAAIATVFRTALAADADVASYFTVGGSGARITLEALNPATNDSTMNFTIDPGTSTGITLTPATPTTTGVQGALIRHSGILSSSNAAGDDGNFQNSFPLVNTRALAADLPQYVSDVITAPAPVTVVTIPPAAKLYDSFSNRERGSFWSDTTGLGSTEGGTAGIKPWTSTTGIYGISGGSVFPYGQGSAFTDYIMADCGSAVQHIVVSGIEGTQIKLRGAAVSDTDWVYASVLVTGGLLFWDVEKVVGGTPTPISGGSGSAAGTMPGVVEFIINGNAVTLKTDGTTRVNTTGTGLPTGTKAGFLLTSQDLAKIGTFEVD